MPWNKVFPFRAERDASFGLCSSPRPRIADSDRTPRVHQQNQCPQNNPEVESDGLLPYVFQIEPNSLLQRSISSPTVHLGPPCDAWSDPVTDGVIIKFLLEASGVECALRSGTDEAHFSPQDVPKLGQFVEAGTTNDVDRDRSPLDRRAPPARPFRPQLRPHAPWFET